MRGFQKVVNEIRWSVAQVLLIPVLLEGVIAFLISYAILSYFNFYPLLSFVPAGLWVIYKAVRFFRIDKIKLVERYYPSLHEKLRTAADHADKSDIMVDELHREVLHDVRDVATSAFLSRKDLAKKTMAVILLSFVLLSITRFGLDSEGLKLKMKEQLAKAIDKALVEKGQSIFNNTLEQRGGSGVGIGVNTDIFGKQNLAKLGDEELDVMINPASVEFKIGKIEDAEKKDFQSVFPTEIYLEQSSTYEEKIPKEQQELVKRYFKELGKS